VEEDWRIEGNKGVGLHTFVFEFSALIGISPKSVNNVI